MQRSLTQGPITRNMLLFALPKADKQLFQLGWHGLHHKRSQLLRRGFHPC